MQKWIDLTFFTDAVGISLIPWPTDADSSVPLNPAFSIDSTSCGEAGILAFFPNACKVVWTFRICCAFRSWRWKKSCRFWHAYCKVMLGYLSNCCLLIDSRYWYFLFTVLQLTSWTRQLWGAYKTIRACTYCLMFCYSTIGIWSTDIRFCTWIDTFSRFTCSIVRTVIVGWASRQ